MIYDKIDNLTFYAGISDDIRLGLEYLRDVKPEVEVGVHELSPRVKAIVSEYTTKEVNELGYEAHRQYIDIQYNLIGEEKISCMPLEQLKETKSYNEATDAAFYQANNEQPLEMAIGNGYFTIFFPQDAHMPQLCIDKPMAVKKVVVKVRYNNSI